MLTTRMQIQIVADRLAGINSKVKSIELDEPWRTCFIAVDGSKAGAEQQALITALQPNPDKARIMEKILTVVPGNGVSKFMSFREVAQTLPPIRFLWPNWIPRGMLSLLGAMPGAGKSFVALDLARRIIAGEPFPDGSICPRPGANVIYVDAELVPQIAKERAAAWNMDTSKLYMMLPNPNDMIDFSRQDCQDTLIEMVFTLEPALVIIDSLSSISSKGENNVEDVRAILGFLNAVASDFQCAVLLIHHLRKRNPLAMMDLIGIDDFRGSSHIIAMSRSVMALSIIQTGPDPDRNGPRHLEIVKTNLNRYPEPLGVNFVPLHPTGVMLQYGEPPQRFHEPTKVETCAAWLLETLQDEPLSSSELIELAEGQFSQQTIDRARKMLGEKISDTDGHKSPKNKWKLASKSNE